MKRYVERDGKFYARVTYIDSSGKQRQIWRRADSKSEAREVAKDLERQLKFGTEPFEQKGTLGEYLDRWLESFKHKVSGRTYQDALNLLRLHVRPALGTKKLSAIRPLDVQKFINDLQKKGLGPRATRHVYAVLFRALKQAVRWRILLHNPAADITLPKIVRKEMKALTPEEAKKFLEVCEADEYGLVFELALVSGMRPEEYMALQWTDLDFKQNTVVVQRVVVWERWTKAVYFAEPKTAKSRRMIPLPTYLMRKLKEHRKQQLAYKLKMGEKFHNEHNLVFTSKTGTIVSIRNLQRRHFKPLLVKAEVPDIRMYDLRHTCATLLLAAGENPKVVSERLGHASIVLTLDTYSHCLPTMQRSATERLEKLLGK